MSGVGEAKQINETYKQKYGNNGPSPFFRVRQDDVALLYFLGNGDKGDPYFEPYIAHELPPEEGKTMRRYMYCPVLSDHAIPNGYTCRWCEAKIKTKRRMAMWFFVQTILHSSLLQGENFPQYEYKGMMYFREDINDFKRWDTSAWDESPLEDIFMLHMQFGSLNTQRSLLMCTGKEIKRRYKIAGEPNTPPLPPEFIQRGQETCEPIMSILQGKLSNDLANESVQRPMTLDSSPTMGLPGVGTTPTPGFGQPATAPQPGFGFPPPPPQQAAPQQDISFGAPSPLPPRGQPLF